MAKSVGIEEFFLPIAKVYHQFSKQYGNRERGFTMNWKGYNELAWTDTLFTDPW